MDILKRNLFIFSLCALFAFVFSFVDEAKAQYRIGYRSVATWKQKENMRVDVSVWYPTRREPSEFRVGEFIVSAARNAPILKIIDEELAPPFREERERIRKKVKKDGKSKWEINQELAKVPLPHKKLPLIVLSHDSGATRYSNHTLAFELAKQGFIVAMPMHVGDNALQMPLLNSSRALTERARQTSATLDLLLSHEILSRYIDDANMTFIGFGSGGSAGLLLAGTDITATSWSDYCAEFDSGVGQDEFNNSLLFLGKLDGNFDEQISYKFNTDINPYCVEPLRSRINHLVVSLQQDLEHSHTTGLFYEYITVARKKLAEAAANIIDRQMHWYKRKNQRASAVSAPFIQPYFPPLTAEQSVLDGRFSRMIFVSPGYSVLYDEDGLSQIEVPILFIGLDQDEINIPKYQSEVLFEIVGDKYADHAIIEGTDIWGLQAPCPETDMVVEICRSVTDKERNNLTSELAEIILDFVPNFEED